MKLHAFTSTMIGLALYVVDSHVQGQNLFRTSPRPSYARATNSTDASSAWGPRQAAARYGAGIGRQTVTDYAVAPDLTARMLPQNPGVSHGPVGMAASEFPALPLPMNGVSNTDFARVEAAWRNYQEEAWRYQQQHASSLPAPMSPLRATARPELPSTWGDSRKARQAEGYVVTPWTQTIPPDVGNRDRYAEPVSAFPPRRYQTAADETAYSRRDVAFPMDDGRTAPSRSYRDSFNGRCDLGLNSVPAPADLPPSLLPDDRRSSVRRDLFQTPESYGSTTLRPSTWTDQPTEKVTVPSGEWDQPPSYWPPPRSERPADLGRFSNETWPTAPNRMRRGHGPVGTDSYESESQWRESRRGQGDQGVERAHSLEPVESSRDDWAEPPRYLDPARTALLPHLRGT